MTPQYGFGNSEVVKCINTALVLDSRIVYACQKNKHHTFSSRARRETYMVFWPQGRGEYACCKVSTIKRDLEIKGLSLFLILQKNRQSSKVNINANYKPLRRSGTQKTWQIQQHARIEPACSSRRMTSRQRAAGDYHSLGTSAGCPSYHDRTRTALGCCRF